MSGDRGEFMEIEECADSGPYGYYVRKHEHSDPRHIFAVPGILVRVYEETREAASDAECALDAYIREHKAVAE